MATAIDNNGQAVKQALFKSTPSYDLDLRDKDQAVEFIRRAVKSGTEALTPWYHQASVNEAWAAGDQFVNWDDDNQNLIEDPRHDESDKRIVPFFTNWLRQYLVRQIARVHGANVSFRATARTSQRADIEAAVSLDRILPHIWERLKMDDPDGVFHAWWVFFNTGSVYANLVWEEDKDAEDEIPVVKITQMVTKFGREKLKEDKHALDGLGAEELFHLWVREELGLTLEQVRRNRDGSIKINRGKLKLNWLTGFDVIEDLSVTPWKDKRWFVIRSEQSVAGIREKYGARAEHVTGKSRKNEDQPLRRVRDRIGFDQHNVFESAEVRTLWIPVSEKYPKGWFVVECEDRVLESGENPYTHGQVPLIPMFESPDRYDVRPSCTFTDLYYLQRAINKLDVQIISHIDKTVEASWLVEEGSVDPNTFLQTKPNVEWYRRGYNAPVAMAYPTLPAHVMIQKQMLIEQFKQLAGLTDPSIGRPTADASSGRAILALNERSDLSLVVPTRALETGLQRVGEQAALLWSQFVPEQVTFEVAGEHGERELVSLIGESLVSKQQNRDGPASLLYDVRVEIKPRPEPAEVVERLDFLLERGVVDPQRNQDAILRVLQDNDFSGLDPTADDRANVAEENESAKMLSDALEAGEVDDAEAADVFLSLIQIRASQEHAVHLKDHGRLLNRMGQKLHPLIVTMMTEHVEQTAAAEAAEAARRQQVLAAAQPQRAERPKKPGGTPGVSRRESRATGGR